MKTTIDPSNKTYALSVMLAGYIGSCWEVGCAHAARAASVMGIPDTTQSIDVPSLIPHRSRGMVEAFGMLDRPTRVYYYGKTMNLVFVNADGTRIGIGINRFRAQPGLFDKLLADFVNAKSC